MNVFVLTLSFCCFFFFSSRRRHTRCSRDWSSDVCSSDLNNQPEVRAALDLIFSDHFSRSEPGIFAPLRDTLLTRGDYYMHLADLASRSEERRVGKECRSRWSPYH